MLFCSSLEGCKSNAGSSSADSCICERCGIECTSVDGSGEIVGSVKSIFSSKISSGDVEVISSLSSCPNVVCDSWDDSVVSVDVPGSIGNNCGDLEGLLPSSEDTEVVGELCSDSAAVSLLFAVVTKGVVITATSMVVGSSEETVVGVVLVVLRRVVGERDSTSTRMLAVCMVPASCAWKLKQAFTVNGTRAPAISKEGKLRNK